LDRVSSLSLACVTSVASIEPRCDGENDKYEAIPENSNEEERSGTMGVLFRKILKGPLDYIKHS
jgi:hypothetical protein